MDQEYVIGVDVGTGSVRVGIFDLKGTMVAHSQKDIQFWHPKENFVEQSTTDIWSSTCASVRDSLASGKVPPEKIVGISFDATCSLVALDRDDRPITVSPTGQPEQNVIVWMDHRAIRQAERINGLKHRVLRFVGGKISPEMEPPKLLWIRENLPETWDSAAKFLDLADFMTYRSTGVDVRSLCTTVCKWTYLGREGRWDRDFFSRLGMRKLLDEKKIGTEILPMGQRIGSLSRESAEELGLAASTVVAVGIIDAHAGGLGMMGLDFDTAPAPAQLEKILALIGGTSSCHMAVSREPKFIPGIWGPYYSAMIPGMWLTEGGQSATGSLLDHILRESGKFDLIRESASEERTTVYQYLNDVVGKVKDREKKGPAIVKDINILPYFHGNRSPRADPTLKGMMTGLTLDESVETIARKYYATIQAIAYGTRHIIEEMNGHGYAIRKIHACGGGTKNPLWLQEHADITGCEIVLPRESEAVLLGSAMLAAVGAGCFGSLMEAAAAMGSAGERFVPRKEYSKYHAARYRVFLKMYEDYRKYSRMLSRF